MACRMLRYNTHYKTSRPGGLLSWTTKSVIFIVQRGPCPTKFRGFSVRYFTEDERSTLPRLILLVPHGMPGSHLPRQCGPFHFVARRLVIANSKWLVGLRLSPLVPTFSLRLMSNVAGYKYKPWQRQG